MKAFSVALFTGVMAWLAAESGFAAEAPAAKETVVYSFGKRGSTDGRNPYTARLVNLNGMLYGTTLSGGYNNYGGTVFSLDPATGAETVLYPFCSQPNCADGTSAAFLTNVNGLLYGTTFGGGRLCSCGTIFSLDPATGTETVLYMFHVCNKKMCTDGDKPFAGMIASKGMLYGTTALGGPGAILHQGTVFAFDPKSSRETVLYSFCSKTDCADGAFPQSELIDVKGTLYGTTAYGGGGPVGACDIYNYYYGCGVVFSLDTATGTEKMLYAFCSKSNCADGGLPQAGLVQTNGILYGTTSQGGDTGCGGGRGCGTVFALDLGKGTLKVLHAFQGGTDGADPYGRLISVNGTLYGTTLDGGDTACNCGTVFSLDPGTGAEKVLYSFLGDRIDGAGPYAGLINVMGTLYGTTYGGGKHNHGTAFSLKP